MTPGRPTKLTPELQAEIVELVGEGAPLETAAQACGVYVQRLYEWLDWGIAGREPYAGFADAVARARARVEIRLLHRVLGEEDDPEDLGAYADSKYRSEVLHRWHEQRSRGAAWLLERLRPQQYAQKINVTVNQAVSEVMEVFRELCAPEDFERACERLAGRDREGGAEAPRQLTSGEGLDS